VFAVLVIVGITVWFEQTSDVAPADIAGVTALTLLKHRDEIRLSAILIASGVFFLLWFLALLKHKRESVDDSSWLPSVAYGGGMVAGAMLLMLASLGIASTTIEDYGGDFVIARVVLVLTWDHLIILAPRLAALNGGTAVVSIRSNVLPLWLGLLSVLLVIAPYSSRRGS
jgi:hypothetical protein